MKINWDEKGLMLPKGSGPFVNGVCKFDAGENWFCKANLLIFTLNKVIIILINIKVTYHLYNDINSKNVSSNYTKTTG